MPFVLRAIGLGYSGLVSDVSWRTHLASPQYPTVTFGIFAHMVFGGLISVIAPLQLIPGYAQRAPRWHRITGYAVFGLAIGAGGGGLVYIVVRGTLGGPVMDLGFSIYGALLIVAAIQTTRHARARRLDQHRDWALRLVVLALGSWIYRVHYGIWNLATGGIGSNRTFTGPFDYVQDFGFYLPYLLVLEAWLWHRRQRVTVARLSG